MPSVRIDRRDSGPKFLEGKDVSYLHHSRHNKAFIREAKQRGIDEGKVGAIILIDGDHYPLLRGDRAFIMNKHGATIDTIS